MSFIDLKDVTKTYKMGEVEIKAVDGVSFPIEKGEFVVIVGPAAPVKQPFLTFWAEWISPHRARLPLTVRIYQSLRKKS